MRPETTAPGSSPAIAMTWRRGAYLSHAAEAWLALMREDAPDGLS